MSKHKSQKDKKRKGHQEAVLTIPVKEAIKYNLEPTTYWNDWADYRDGFRAWYDDRSRIHKITYRWQPYDVIKNNVKLKKQLIIRKLRKNHKLFIKEV